MGGVPKAELHLHLDCAASYGAVAALRPETTLAEFRRDFVAPATCGSLTDFLTRPPRIVELMQDRRGLRVIVDDVFDQLGRDGVVYAEIRFAPLLHTAGGLRADQVVEIVDRAVADAVAATGTEARLILSTLRHFTPEQSVYTAELVQVYAGSLVVALDLAGDEAGFPLDAHEPAFRYAREHGLARTAHADEAAGPASVWETLKRLRPDRIGHGVRSVEDHTLVQHLLRERIHLETCPSCNVRTAVVDAYRDHPVAELYERGVHVSVNTDARTVADATLSHEHERLRHTFGWGEAELMRCTRNAIEAAFCDETTRASLLAALSQSGQA